MNIKKHEKKTNKKQKTNKQTKQNKKTSKTDFRLSYKLITLQIPDLMHIKCK